MAENDNTLFERGLKELTDGQATPATRHNDALGVDENGVDVQDGDLKRFIPFNDSQVVQTDDGLIVQQIDVGGQIIQFPALNDPPIQMDGDTEYLVLRTGDGNTKRIKLM